MNSVRLVLRLMLVLGAIATPSGAIGGALATDRPAPADTPAARVAARRALARLPLLFVENRGQTDARVAWTLEGRGLSAYFGAEGVTYAQVRDGKRWAIQLGFVGANPGVKPKGAEPGRTVFSWFRGPREQWRTGVPSCTTLVYSELWPGIDLTYTARGNRLKYAFTVKPGADPSRIRIACRGAQVRVEDSGELDLSTPLGSVRDAKPSSAQTVGGRAVDVPTAFRVAPGDDGTATFGFDVGAFDASRPLVIDPAVVIYAGYIGGTSTEFGAGIAVGADGSAYVTGATLDGTGFPTAAGPDLSFNGGNADVFVAKVAVDGSGLVYAGFIGGSAGDYGYDIAVDTNGNAYVTGNTSSNHLTFPVKDGPDVTSDFEEDQFVAKVNAAGTALDYCGYIPGTTTHAGIAVDEQGSAYLTGTVSFPDTFEASVGPTLRDYGGGNDAYFAKLTPNGTGYVYAGYIGGASGDSGRSIAIDAAHNVYVTGHTLSDASSFPALVGPDLSVSLGGDLFVAKVKSDGSGLEYCGYVGGVGTELAVAIAVDPAGAAYVVGNLQDPAAFFPVKAGPDFTHNGGYDAFIAKVKTDGTGLDYAGFIGGPGFDYAADVAVDADGNAYVAGNTSSDETTFPVFSGPDLTYGGGVDAFVAKVKADGTVLMYCGYLGGDQEEGVNVPPGIAVDAAGNAYVSASTQSVEPSFPVAGGPDVTHNGARDAFVAKVQAGTDVPPAPAPPPVPTLNVTARSGLLTDSTKVQKDKITVSGKFVFNSASPDGKFVKGPDAVAVSVGDAVSPIEFYIAPGPVGWKTVNGRHTWTSPKNARPKRVVVIDTRKKTFSVTVTNATFVTPPQKLIHVSLILGNDAGAHEATWKVKPPKSARMLQFTK